MASDNANTVLSTLKKSIQAQHIISRDSGLTPPQVLAALEEIEATVNPAPPDPPPAG